jgi:hypothetical protein
MAPLTFMFYTKQFKDVNMAAKQRHYHVAFSAKGHFEIFNPL